MTEFLPHPLLRNSHIMTIFPAFNLFGSSSLTLGQSEPQLVRVAEDSQILIQIHRVASTTPAPCVVLVHGLEGSADSPYLVSLAAKANALGLNAVRVNLRNCGGTLHLTPTLYNAGLSGDILSVVNYLRDQEHFGQIFLVGYSLGGNIVLKLASELGDAGGDSIHGVCAVSPAIDLSRCVNAMEIGINRFYGLRFVHGLKRKVRAKAKLFPGRYDLAVLNKVSSLRDFDERFTAPDAGFPGAAEYYAQCSSLRTIERIAVPTLIIAAQDDPIVPFESFKSPKLQSKYITLLAPKFGGHGGFVHLELEQSEQLKTKDRLWAENRILEFCLHHRLSD